MTINNTTPTAATMPPAAGARLLPGGGTSTLRTIAAVLRVRDPDRVGTLAGRMPEARCPLGCAIVELVSIGWEDAQ